jgi:hypothetical protein
MARLIPSSTAKGGDREAARSPSIHQRPPQYPAPVLRDHARVRQVSVPAMTKGTTFGSSAHEILCAFWAGDTAVFKRESLSDLGRAAPKKYRRKKMLREHLQSDGNRCLAVYTCGPYICWTRSAMSRWREVTLL